MRIFIWVLSIPLLFMSLLFEMFMTRGVRSELELCLTAVEGREMVPECFIKALVVAEDHRSNLHYGVDPIALIRVLLHGIRQKKFVGGASTIEQQFVRVITKRYERTVSRKVREQMLAVMVSRRISKAEIASAYLSVGFYGTEFVGVKGLKAIFGNNLEIVTFYQALLTVVQLKYPRPRDPDQEWGDKVFRRVSVIMSRLEKGCYNSVGLPSIYLTTLSHDECLSPAYSASINGLGEK